MSECPPGTWVTDTVAFTHLARAGHLDLLEKLAPEGVVVVPSDVSDEIEEGRDRYPSIPSITSLEWVTLVVPDHDEEWTLLDVKAQLGGGPKKNIGESAVIAVAKHRGGVAILDDAGGRHEAAFRNVQQIGTLWIVIEAYKTLLHEDRPQAERIVDDLLATDMRLPVSSGANLFAWAYEQGLLP